MHDKNSRLTTTLCLTLAAAAFATPASALKMQALDTKPNPTYRLAPIWPLSCVPGQGVTCGITLPDANGDAHLVGPTNGTTLEACLSSLVDLIRDHYPDTNASVDILLTLVDSPGGLECPRGVGTTDRDQIVDSYHFPTADIYLQYE